MSGWTSLFKRSPKLKAEPLIRWFGKIPATREYNDYYRSASEPWMSEFHEDWLIRGYELYAQRVRSGNQGRPSGKNTLPVSSCILRLPKSGMTVLTAILDFGGDTIGRQFPMCFYVGMPTAELPGPTSDWVGSALRVLRQLTGMQREVARFLNEPGQKKPEQFTAVFRDREAHLDALGQPDGDAWQRAAQSIRMGEWFARTGGALGAPDVDSWMKLADAWGARIAAAECADFEATLSFPVVPGISSEIQVVGWVRWLESRMDLARRAVTLMLTEEPAPQLSRLSLVSRDLMPEDFLLLTPKASELSYVDDLLQVRETTGSNGSATEGAGPPGAECTWSEFVQAQPKLAGN